ncbi:hypothetical protein PR002_g680 [Phytophthora rubi]|uniref:Uncharacterized protein n=1 Tax=Phytophthora rubi TaxID=129364 RepID=A0A6A3NTW4_9STRA|nr:hypothetical protein PR002_g680 [Phytophthora rubi]
MVIAWNAFVVKFKLSPSDRVQQFKTRRDKFFRSTIRGAMTNVHEMSMAGKVRCAVEMKDECPFCYKGIPSMQANQPNLSRDLELAKIRLTELIESSKDKQALRIQAVLAGNEELRSQLDLIEQQTSKRIGRQLNYLKVSPGTAAASRALVVDASKTILGIGTMSVNAMTCGALSLRSLTITQVVWFFAETRGTKRAQNYTKNRKQMDAVKRAKRNTEWIVERVFQRAFV